MTEPATIVVAPSGTSYVWMIRDGGPLIDNWGWKRADNRQDAVDKALDDLKRFGMGRTARGDIEVLEGDDPSVPPNPKMGGLEETAGEIDELWEVGGEPVQGSHYRATIVFGGACPVQGEGTVDGMQAYYRARGTGWSLEVTITEGEVWTYSEALYAWPDGGWLHRDETIEHIRKAVGLFRARLHVRGQGGQG